MRRRRLVDAPPVADDAGAPAEPSSSAYGRCADPVQALGLGRKLGLGLGLGSGEPRAW